MEDDIGCIPPRCMFKISLFEPSVVLGLRECLVLKSDIIFEIQNTVTKIYFIVSPADQRPFCSSLILSILSIHQVSDCHINCKITSIQEPWRPPPDRLMLFYCNDACFRIHCRNIWGIWWNSSGVDEQSFGAELYQVIMSILVRSRSLLHWRMIPPHTTL